MNEPGGRALEVGRRLQLFRKREGRTQAEVSEVLGVSRPTVAAIEAGQRRLDSRLLIALANAYGVPLSELVREAPPPVALLAQFRLPADSSEPERLELERAVGRLELLATNYGRLERLVESPLRATPAPVYSYSPRRIASDAERAAESERRRLGAGDGPVLRLRSLLEREMGMRIFSLPLPSEIAALYALSGDAGPCLAVNSKHAHVRQRWSYVHELAHFLTRSERPEVTRASGYQRVPEHERFAERFAAAFLMPAAGLERRLHELETDDRRVTVADLILLASEYEVSLQALALRLEGIHAIGAGTWDGLIESGANIHAASRALGVTPAAPDTVTFPERFVLLALEAYDRELLTERELADLLEQDRLALRRLLQQVEGGAVEGGLETGLRLSTSVSIRAPA